MTEYDYRWTKKDGTKHTYLGSLQAMCNSYGGCSGLCHSNEFWASTKKQIPLMTEGEAEKKVREIEADAEAEVEYWRRTQ